MHNFRSFWLALKRSKFTHCQEKMYFEKIILYHSLKDILSRTMTRLVEQQICSIAFLKIFFYSQVMIFQVAQNTGRSENFTFAVDGSLQNLTVYITGLSSLTFSLTNPAGDVESSVLVNFNVVVFVLTRLPPCQVFLRAPVRQTVP